MSLLQSYEDKHGAALLVGPAGPGRVRHATGGGRLAVAFDRRALPGLDDGTRIRLIRTSLMLPSGRYEHLHYLPEHPDPPSTEPARRRG